MFAFLKSISVHYYAYQHGLNDKKLVSKFLNMSITCTDPEGGGGAGFLSNIAPDPL